MNADAATDGTATTGADAADQNTPVEETTEAREAEEVEETEETSRELDASAREHVFIKNVYYMLAYAFSALKQAAFASLATETFDNIHDLYAAILAKGIALQVKQGLYREYVNRVEPLPVVRGKIDMPGTVRERLAGHRAISCEYDELSEDNPYNRILKSAAMLLFRQPDVNPQRKAELKKGLMYFANVMPADLARARFDMLRFHRNNRTYQLLLGICQLIAQEQMLATDTGERRLARFDDEQRLSRLYEKFILNYYKQEFAARIPGFTARASQVSWQLDAGSDDALLPTMQTDVTLTYGDRTLIIDAKFYGHALQTHYGASTIHSANLYQIFTYVKNEQARVSSARVGGLHEVAGMLLYAKTDEEVVPHHVYTMSGNRIAVRTLDLSVDFAQIRRQLDGIVGQWFGITIGG